MEGNNMISLASIIFHVKDFVAKTGVKPEFVAFNAHWGFAFALMTFMPSWWTFAVIVALAAVKEFWFDANYEVPKQTNFDNWTDFAGYLFGVCLAAVHTF